MKYQRIVTEVEALQFDGDTTALLAFMVKHSDHNRDVRNRPDPILGEKGGQTKREQSVAIWIEKHRGYGAIGFGDYVLAEADGSGVSVCPREQFEATHVPLR